MADQIRVNFGALDTAVADISTGVATQGQRLSELKAHIAPMVASWEGSAQAAYHAHQTVWDNAWEELTQALTQFRSATDTATQDYRAGEAANAGSWS